MIAATVRRTARWGKAVIVSGVDHVDDLERAVGSSNLDIGEVLSEPEGRNTAPAIAAAAMTRSNDPVLLVFPADHVIRDLSAFEVAVELAVEAAGEGWLVTFGAPPTRPETGYGYIQLGEAIGEGYLIERFVEKPDAGTAAVYAAGDEHLWNSGMFAFRASVVLGELQRYQPELLDVVRQAVDEAERSGRRTALGERFSSAPSISIDVAVMERTDRGMVIPLDAGWTDIGSWEALWDIEQHDADGNVVLGDVLLNEVTGSYVRSTSRLVSVAGVDDVIVVETPEAVLVVGRQHSQMVKGLVEKLGERNEA
jgi:mannose-1-phosphate guanylyltransferase/mannose-6-phosphate isomerase